MKNRRSLIVGIVAAVCVLAALLAFVLVQCSGQPSAPATTAPTTETVAEEPVLLYYNLDLEDYSGKSEAGMSSRMQEADGYFHIRFFLDGEIVTLKAADRKVVNKIDVTDVMGLEFDENGIIVGVIPPEDMPMEMVGWRFFVQSAARTMLKLNSSEGLNGMEILLEDLDPDRIWDMSGRSGPKGTVGQAIQFDRVKVVLDLEGNVTHVFIVERPYYMLTHEGYCQHCDKEVTWNEWVQTDNVPLTAGHYQLQNDVQLKTQASMQEDAKICLDLNGYRIDGKEGTRLYSVHNPGGALAIMDTSEGQTGVIAAHGKTSAGGSCLWPRYGALYLYGGTVDASDVITTGNGAAVYVPKNSYFYMYGGTIVGGTADITHNPENNTYGAGTGGNLYVVGKFVMYDGVIKNGDAKAATYYSNGKKTISRGLGGNLYLSGTGEFEMNGGTIENGKAGGAGANIYATSTANMVINGGTISGGRISGEGKNGGSIFLGSKTTTTINGGSIVGGVSYNGGGNVYCNGRLTMNAGYIGGGVCYSYTTGKRNPDNLNYNLMVVNGRFSMYGGKIAGGVGITDSKADDVQTTVVLSGYATINDGPNGHNLYLSASGDGIKVKVGNLYDSARISVHTTRGLFTEPTDEKNLDNFLSDIPGADVVYFDQCLGLGRISCVCGKEAHMLGCEGEKYMWAPWVSTTSLPKTTGNFYLLDSVTTTSQTVVYAGYQVMLDLNGKDATYAVKTTTTDGFRLYRSEEGAELTITDTTENPGTMKTIMPGEDAVYPGTTVNSAASVKDADGNIIEKVFYTEDEMRAFWAKANSGMVLWARGGKITVYNGIFDGSDLTGASTGMVVYVNNRTVKDAETGESKFYRGDLTMYGGTIIGGYTREKGNVAVAQDAVLNVYGGTIRDGRSNMGGNIHVDGTMHLYGGTVKNGMVDRSQEAVDGGQGGNISVGATGALYMQGGTVKDGFVRGGKNGGGQGGNIQVSGIFEATGGIISGGDAGSGGNIGTISADSFIRLKNVQVLDGQADAGGNLLIGVRTNKGLELLEGTVISGGHARSSAKAGNGGNLAVNLSSNGKDQEQVILIDGAVIKDGTSLGTGGNIRVRNLTADQFDANGKQTQFEVNVKIVMRSGTISGGSCDTDRTDSAIYSGGNVYLSENSQFILEGGTVETGDCSDGGGNFYVNGTLEIKGGKVQKGTLMGSGYSSSNIFVVGGKLLLSGGVVDGNVAASNNGTVVLSGKPVVQQGDKGGITLRNGVLLEIEGVLEEGASVCISGRGYVSKAVAAGNEAYLHSDKGYTCNYLDGRIFLGKVACLCGSDTHAPGCVDAMSALGLTIDDRLAMLPVESGDDLASGGYWYLPKDMPLDQSVYITQAAPLVLDLNGNTLTSTRGSFLFTTQNSSGNTVFVITDPVGGGKIVLSGTNTTTAQGGILRASGSAGKDVVYVLGGTLDASAYPLQSEKLGGTVAYITNGNTIKQYGGTFVGRDSKAAVAAGNTVHVRQGTYMLLGGTVTGGSAKNGGNIYIDTNGTFLMSGGTVEGGTATTEGNNLYVLGSFTMNGGEASGVYVNSNQVSLTGDATIAKGEAGYGLKVASGKTVDVTGLTGSISVSAEAGKAFAVGAVASMAETNVTSELSGEAVTFYEDDFLYMGKAADIYCICGATLHGEPCQDNGQLHRWTDWTAADQLPATSGYYRLTTTVHVDAAKVANLANGEQIYLDLCGQTVNLENGEDLYTFKDHAGALVVITDSSANAGGKAVISGSHSANGGFADIKVGNTVELYRATLDASDFSTAENGAVFAVRGSFVMHSGKIIGGEATGNLKNGGTLWMAKGSRADLLGGQVIGGRAGRWGGALYVTGEGTVVTIDGATITGGHAAVNGGAIIVRDKGVLNILSGTVTGGTTNGAGKNIFVDGTGVLNFSGGTVTGGLLVNGNGATISGSAVVNKSLSQTNAPATSLEISSGMTVDLTNFNGTAYVTAAPGEVFATGAASLAESKVLSEVTYEGFRLPVVAADGKLSVETSAAVHCICGASLHGYACQDDGKLYYWQAWNEANTLPAESGYYRLTGNVELTSTAKLTTAEHIYLDFNGFTVTQTDMERMYNLTKNVDIRLVLTDSSKDGKGGAVITGTRTDSNGGFLDLQAGNHLELYRATLDASDFYIKNGNGSAISSRGNILMHSGTIQGGRLDSGTKHGATLWLTDSSQTVVKDGLIVGGRAGRWAGTVYIAAANTYFKLEGGRVEGGTADELGGSFMVRNGTLHITGGTITGGTVTDGEGANIAIQTSGTLNMEGGIVTGGVYIASDAKAVTITGSAVIDKSLSETNAPAYGLKLASGKTVDVAGLTGKVYVTADAGKAFAVGATEAMAETNVLSETELKAFFVEPNKLHMGAVYCVCGATLHGEPCQDDGTMYTWTDWNETNKLPTDSGWYRLTEDINMTSQVKITTEETIYLDLNGHTIHIVNGNRLYNLTKGVAGTIVITDTSRNAGGKVVVTGTSSGINGGILNLEAGHKFELYRATLDASGLHCAGGNGAAISSRGNMVIHSGTILGGRLDSGTKHGATLWLVDGSQTLMKDGLIKGGTSGRWGGVMYINAANTLFKMEGGCIEGGTSELLAGSLMVRAGATFHMTGGVVTGGVVTNGGDGYNVYVYDTSSTFKMEGGTIHGGVYSANNVTISGNAVIDKSLTDTTKYAAPAYSLKLASGKTANVADLTGTVYVTGAANAVVATNATAAMAEAKVCSEVASLKVVLTDSTKLKLTAK